MQNQLGNLFLWTPFVMAAGGALFFGGAYNPSPAVMISASIIIAGLVCVFRRNIFVRAVALFVFGFVYAAVFTSILNTPKLTHDLRETNIVGTVTKIDYTDAKARIYLRVKSEDIDAIGRRMANIRLSLSDMPTPGIGDVIRANVNLYSPSVPYAPDSFDYARWAYFNNLSATGYIREYDVITPGASVGIESLRNKLHNASNSFLVDSLVLGYKAAVSEDDNKIWTATGIGHVWSISGFHMTLVGGWLFAIFFCVFRLIAPITRRGPARVPALICAWVGLLFYLFLSGVDVATVRAFLMTTFVFAAFICGRSAISLRNAAIAFCVIFFINPHYIMQAGFQLSFAAIFGLIWLWSEVSPKMPTRKIFKIIYATILTSVVASVFTTPFVIAHFGALPIYSLIGNLVLIPIFSIAIMPLVIIGAGTAIFGWTMPIDLAHTIYDFTFRVATHIADLPAANCVMPHMPNGALIIFTIGFCALIFIRAKRINYILCAMCIMIGILFVALQPRPKFISTYDNELVAFITDDKIEFNKLRASNHFFAFDTWKQLAGFPTGTKNSRRKHDKHVWRFGDIVYVQKFTALQENIAALCADENVKYIVSYFDVRSQSCAHKILRGAFIIYENNDIKRMPFNRPWHNLH